jgi:hypothetical protein
MHHISEKGKQGTMITHLAAEVDLDDMEYRPESKEFRFLCRCGHYYIISEAQMEQSVNIVQCRGCSLCIKVLYDESNGQDY